MKSEVRKVAVPVDSAITAAFKRSDFVDAYEVQIKRTELTVNAAYVAIFCYPKPWVQALMNLRGYIAVCLGLSHPFNVSKIQPNDEEPRFEIGQRVGSFTVQSMLTNEVIVGDDDRHLNFRISTTKTERGGCTYITVSTSVEIHNLVGRVYMFVVRPFHQFLAPYMLKAAVLSGRI